MISEPELPEETEPAFDAPAFGWPGYGGAGPVRPAAALDDVIGGTGTTPGTGTGTGTAARRDVLGGGASHGRTITDPAPGSDVIGRGAGPGDPAEPGVPGLPGLLAGLRGNWRWALGGLAVASALWTTGLYVYGHVHRTGPDLHGYRLGPSPCGPAVLRPITGEIGDSRPAANPAEQVLGPALDLTRCELYAHSSRAGGWTAAYRTVVTVELHKKTDPRPEFEDQRALHEDSLEPAQAITTVPGLGDRAYLVKAAPAIEVLKVLHGGAVFTITITGDTRFTDLRIDPTTEAPDLPDMTRLQPGMIASVRNMMSLLRK